MTDFIATKAEFDAYEKVRKSGVTNMLDTKKVMALSGLTRAKINAIMMGYAALNEDYGDPCERRTI